MIRFTFLLALCCFVISPALAQADSAATAERPLALGRAINGSLATGGAHAYAIEFEAGRFVYGQVVQHTVDVVVTVTGPDGDTLATLDASARGPDDIQFVTEIAGRHQLEVAPFEDGAGSYTLEIVKIEPEADTPAGRIDQFMSRYESPGTPGAVIAVVEGGEIVFSDAYGLANLTHGIAFTTDTVTNIGSTSKQFTAFAICLLAERGELSIDDDVRDHIPELPDLGHVVTIRHLLTHTSGYREFLNTLAMAGRRLDEGEFIERSELIEVVQRQPALQEEPGTLMNYNNTGFGLLTMIVERVSGIDFPAWMDANVFTPLGMDHTFVREHRAQIIPNSAQGYLPDEQFGYREVLDLPGAMGAGGIYTTVGDLARWIGNFREAELGSPELLNSMMTSFVLANGDSTGYGFGLFVDEYRGLHRIHHGGADTAHRSMLMYLPELDAAIITLSNNGSFPPSIANRMADAFYDKHMDSADAAQGEEAGEADVEFDPDQYDPESFDELVGRYVLDALGLTLTFSRDGEALYTQATGQPAVEVNPTSELTFEIAALNASIGFHRDDDGEVTSLTLHQGGQYEARRLEDEPWQPTDENFVSYTGRYFSEELETFYVVVHEDAELVVRHRRYDDLTLTPQEEDTFNGGFPLINVQFRRDDEGNVVAFEASSGRTNGVVFTKQE